MVLGKIKSQTREDYYIVDKELLKKIENEVSGERAWDVVSRISAFARARKYFPLDGLK